jgi:formate dehydrogenase subunit gamma
VKGEDMQDTAAVSGYVQRFSLYRIIEHWLVATVFIVMVATGLSQKYYSFELAQWFVISLGGIDVVRIVHRVVGVVFSCLIAQHVLVAFYGVLFRRWRPSILITRKDFTDAVDNLKYYFGLTNVQARCDRYDYKQKFEYWGILAGGLIMIATGLTLWFPAFVARYLPGSLIPAAKAMHTSVAMMIFLIIAIWHIYNSIFSPEVFPLDTVIFTGKISRDRMMREHPIEFERLFGVSLEERKHEIVSHNELKQERRQESS